MAPTLTMSSDPLSAKLDKIRAPGLESQRQTAAVLSAVESTLREQVGPAKPNATAYFAALLALLTQPSLMNGNAQEDVATSVVYLLDLVTPFAPAPLLRAKFTQILTLLGPPLSQPDATAALLRPAVGCLETLLLAQQSTSWELSVTEIGPRRAVVGLLTLSSDPRPKVRKRALEALKKVLQNPPLSPSVEHPASALCAESALATLDKSIRAWGTSSSGGPGQDAAIMHALQLVRVVASASGGWPSSSIESLCQLLLSVAKDGGQHAAVAVFDVFETVFETMASETASSKLPRLLSAIDETRPKLSDVHLLPPWLTVFSRAYDVSAQLDADEVFTHLPQLVMTVSAFLESEFLGVRISASECLLSLLTNCVPQRILLEPTVYDEKILEAVSKELITLLAVRFQAARKQVFTVLAGAFATLRWRSDPYLLEAVRVVGEMRGEEMFGAKAEADVVLGSAIRAIGPAAVLDVLPLNLSGPNAGRPGRAWLLSHLRDYTSNTTLRHFRTELIPLSELMFQRVLDHGAAEKTTEIKVFETLVQQIWSTFPGYCDLPLDLQTAFDHSFAELLANLLYQQVGLRQDICRGLRALIESNQAIAAIEGKDEDLVLQNRLTTAEAKANLQHLGDFAGNFLAILFNVYSQTLPQSRAALLETIDLFLSITPESDVVDTFVRVHGMLLDGMRHAEEQSPEQGGKTSAESATPNNEQTLLDLVITMSVYLPRDQFASLYALASQALLKQEQPQLQKKAYKLIPRLSASVDGQTALVDRIEEMQSLLLASADKVSVPARRERLGAIAALVPLLPATDLHFIPSVISEVVMCCKEHNERTREAAFDLLASMGRKLSSSEGAMIDNTRVPHMPADTAPVPATMDEYLTMISAGLAGTTPHMISATITALSRVVYEFRESISAGVLSDLVDTMDLFLTSNNREIVKAALGFVKVATVSLPVDFMAPRLASLIPKLLVWSHEHKGHLRAKVKHILERMLRRFGFDAVVKRCPEEDRKLLVNIKKTKERNKRKKASADASDGESDVERARKTEHFQSEFDAALYSSDEEFAQDHDAGTHASRRSTSNKASKSSRATYIVEDEDEPLDLLGRGALAKISSTKPSRRKQLPAAKAKVNEDGKLILGPDSEDDGPGNSMELDVRMGESAAEEQDGVGAYVSALRSGDVAKRGQRGKLKFSNRKKPAEDDDEAGDAELPQAANPTRAMRPAISGHSRGASRGASRGVSSGRAGKGRLVAGRRGLGEDKRHGPSMPGRISKHRSSARRGRR